MLRKTYALCLLGLTSAILMVTPVRAQMPQAGFILNAAPGNGKVDLTWQQPTSLKVSYYLVYKAGILMTQPPSQSSFSVIDSTADTKYQDVINAVPMILVGFIYKVEAFSASGDSLSSNEAVVDVRQLFGPRRDQVTITSNPPLDATVDSLYTYQVEAVSDSPSATLHYGFGPQLALYPALSMTIDSTGLLSWTPKARGWYPVEVIVTSSLGGEARQGFTVRVAGIDGKIAGTVTDTLGNPLAHVIVHLYQTRIPLPYMRVTEPPIMFFDYKAETDSEGHYLIDHVDKGNYFVHADPLNPNYLPEWFDNVTNIKDATSIMVINDSTHVADFKLENRFHLLPKFTVSGMVTDSTGAAVKGAWVVFASAGFVYNEAREDQEEWSNDVNFRDFFNQANHDRNVNHDFGLDDIHSPYVFRTYVDSNGAYLDTLPEGRYLVFANAAGYDRTFFNNEFNLLSADILALTSDTTGISFTLYPVPPVVLGQISGSVIDSTSGAGVAARVIAFRDIWTYRDTLKVHVIGSYSADADSTGAYTFNNLPPGYYKIIALPLGDYAPSFYSLSGPTVRWKEATAVPVSGNAVSGINIYVLPLPDSVSGYVSINGSVKNSSSQAGIGGAIVYAADGNGNILGYGVTDKTGSYTISGLAPDSYNLFVDAVGYTSTGSYSSSPSYDASGNPVPSTKNLTASPETPAVVNQKSIQPTSYSLEQNYPNPFNPTTEIAFNLAQTERVNISIFNILGQRVATILDGEMGAGAHVVMWNGRNQNGEVLPSGVYFYKLSTENFSAVKKMLLLK